LKKTCIEEILQTYKAEKPSPEWGGGGIYGLHYHHGHIILTRAFEAETIVASTSCQIETYHYEQIGPPPRSGGDTYNAVTAVDNRIYFGGWVHAPADYRDGKLLFTNKYSHIHYYDTDNYEFKLIWRESIHHPTQWAGEVTDLEHNPLTGDLLVARGDGQQNIGAYILRKTSQGWRIQRLTKGTYLRVTTYNDKACYIEDPRWTTRPFHLKCYDLETYREEETITINPAEPADMLGPITYPRPGDITPLHTGVYLTAKGLLAIINEETVKTIRLLDMGPAPYSPFRCNNLPILGGILAAYNTAVMTTITGTDEVPREIQEASKTPPLDTLLLHITPTSIRIIARLGLRATSLALVAGEIWIATNTLPNLERYDATKTDWSTKTITKLPPTLITNPQPPPITITLRGKDIQDKPFGGIPLEGYKTPKLTIKATKTNTLHITTYTPQAETIDQDKTPIKPGKNTIPLTQYTPLITAMKLEKPDPKATIIIHLQP